MVTGTHVHTHKANPEMLYSHTQTHDISGIPEAPSHLGWLAASFLGGVRHTESPVLESITSCLGIFVLGSAALEPTVSSAIPV